MASALHSTAHGRRTILLCTHAHVHMVMPARVWRARARERACSWRAVPVPPLAERLLQTHVSRRDGCLASAVCHAAHASAHVRGDAGGTRHPRRRARHASAAARARGATTYRRNFRRHGRPAAPRRSRSRTRRSARPQCRTVVAHHPRAPRTARPGRLACAPAWQVGRPPRMMVGLHIKFK